MEKDFYPLIFRFLDSRTVMNSMMVNKFYYKLAKNNSLWNNFCLKKNYPTNVKHDQYINYQKCYIISKWCIGRGIKYVFFQTKLYLFNKNLISIPPEIGALINLQKLNLSGNNLTSIPHEVGNLIYLKKLYLYNNKITNIPPELGNLSNLQILNIGNNNITSIPPELGNLSNLKELSLSVNNITSIPPELGNLTNLQRLYLGNNKITSIPPELGALTNLQELYLNRINPLELRTLQCDTHPRNFKVFNKPVRHNNITLL